MPGLEAFQLFKLRPFAVHRAHGPRPGRMRRPRHKHRDAQLLRQHCQTIDMIGMFVGDQNRRERLRIFAQRLHALKRFAAGDAGIDQNLCARAGHERTIPPASAGQHRNRHTHAGSIRARPVD